LATMCLTESHAGSDLGLLRTRAEPDAGGADEQRYRVTGNKIFISGGEHDLSPNILHLVLARLPDAPVGTKGISLFLVPKLLPTDGGLQANGVHCDRIEKKMGIKGSATCSMNFDGAVGWIIGEPHRGLQAMFVMMNAARLHVALQGLAHSEIAHQNALNYARERMQMRAPKRVNPAAPADPIIQHPAMRRILLEQRATLQAERIIAYWTAHLMDLAEQHPDAARRAESALLVPVLTPVVKSMLTENGFAHASSALQVFGGHGYIHDNGIEQSVRDSRIAMVYEGTTEIQAIDLITRKVIADRGKAFGLLVGIMQDEAKQCAAIPACAAFATQLEQQIVILQRSAVAITKDIEQDPERPLRAAVDFQILLGIVLWAFAWARAVRVDQAHVTDADAQERLVLAQFYYDFKLPEAAYRQQLIEVACKALPVLS
jgi:alkylation response protein AidB-like acyl-CoA dehydrogenase